MAQPALARRVQLCEDMATQIKKVLVPIDFSPGSKQAIALACDLAKPYGAELMLLHVYQTPGFVYPDGFMPVSAKMLREMLTKIDEGMTELERHAQRCGAARVKGKTIEGAPAAEIVREASAGNFDLIVMGTHGHTGIKHALLGSVAENVVRRAECPVLTVRLQKKSTPRKAEKARAE